jgi:hypothetical protein
MYSEPTKELALRNWTKFNGSTSPKVVSCIKSELLNVKDRVLIEYVNGMYTASQEEQEQEQEEEEEKNNNKFDFKKSLLSFGFDSILVDEWLKVRRVKKAVNSEIAFKGFIREVELNGQDKNLILQKCIEKGWRSFECDWLPKPKQETSVSSNSVEEVMNSLKGKI